MTDTPLELFLQAFDRLDADARAALFAAHGRLRYVDGRVDEGAEAVRDPLREYFADISSTTHTLGAHWHEVYAAVEPSFHATRIRHERQRDRGMMVDGRWVPPL